MPLCTSLCTKRGLIAASAAQASHITEVQWNIREHLPANLAQCVMLAVSSLSDSGKRADEKGNNGESCERKRRRDWGERASSSSLSSPFYFC